MTYPVLFANQYDEMLIEIADLFDCLEKQKHRRTWGGRKLTTN